VLSEPRQCARRSEHQCTGHTEPKHTRAAVALLRLILRGMRHRAVVILDPYVIPRIDPAVARFASEKMFDLTNASTIGALAEQRPARSRWFDMRDLGAVLEHEESPCPIRRARGSVAGSSAQRRHTSALPRVSTASSRCQSDCTFQMIARAAGVHSALDAKTANDGWRRNSQLRLHLRHTCRGSCCRLQVSP